MSKYLDQYNMENEKCIDPFDEFWNIQDNVIFYHLVEINRDSEHVKNVKIYSSNKNNFISACYDYIINKLGNCNDETKQELLTVIDISISFLDFDIYLDVLDEIGYDFLAGYELRYCNKKNNKYYVSSIFV